MTDHAVSPLVEAGVLSKTVRYIECPWCHSVDASFLVDHLLAAAEKGAHSAFGPWYCNACGHSIRGRVDAGGRVLIAKNASVETKTRVTLRSEEPVTLIVEGIRIAEPDDVASPSDLAEQDRYFYEEHTCPTNFIGGQVVEVRDDAGNTDPHGIFRYVQTEENAQSEVRTKSPL